MAGHRDLTENTEGMRISLVFKVKERFRVQGYLHLLS
jgi:hypothetical protein